MMRVRPVILSTVALLGAPLGGMCMADEAVHPLLSEGESAYRMICAHCHGPALQNPGTASFDLRTFPTDQPDRFYESVTDGRGGMAAFGDVLLEGELDALWVYVATRAGTQPFPPEAEPPE